MKEMREVSFTKLVNGYLVILTIRQSSTSFFVKNIEIAIRVATQFLEEEKSMAEVIQGLEQ